MTEKIHPASKLALETAILEHYRKAWELSYGDAPRQPSRADVADIKKLLYHYPDKTRLKGLITHFLTMDGYNNYFRSRGHSLALLVASCESVNADYLLEHKKSSSSDMWVNGYSVSGEPVIAKKRQTLRPGFTPVELTTWYTQSHGERLQGLAWKYMNHQWGERWDEMQLIWDRELK